MLPMNGALFTLAPPRWLFDMSLPILLIFADSVPWLGGGGWELVAGACWEGGEEEGVCGDVALELVARDCSMLPPPPK